MSDIETHFVAVCPHCQAGLRIRRVYLGQQVGCKHCDRTFLAAETPVGTETRAAGPGEAGLPDQSTTESDRIVVMCPSCQSPLKVRRNYIGLHVTCKRCNHTFPVVSPADPEPKPDVGHTADVHEALRAGPDRLLAENHGLQAERRRLLDVQGQLQAAHARMKSECDERGEPIERGANELESIRAELGGITPTEVRTLAAERAALAAERERLEAEIKAVRDELAARDRAAADREHEQDCDLQSARAELGRLTDLLQVRDRDLAAARAEQEGAGAIRQEALDEAQRLHVALAERDRANQESEQRLRGEVDHLRAQCDRLCGEADRLRGEAERIRTEDENRGLETEALRHALAQAEQADREALTRFDLELAELTGHYRELQDRHAAMERLCREYHERNEQLRAELHRLESAAVAPRNGEASPEARTAGSSEAAPDHSRATADRTDRDEELQAARADADDLRRQLNEAERVRSEMAAILSGMGITVRIV